ncbi:unnamed protein product [Camellia sinensis]
MTTLYKLCTVKVNKERAVKAVVGLVAADSNMKLRLMQTPLRTMLVLEVYSRNTIPVFCKIDQPTRCRYQNADWRLRPLPDEMLRLLSASTESENSDEPLVEGFVGMAKDVNAIVIAFKGTQERRRQRNTIIAMAVVYAGIGGRENFFHCNKCRCCYSVLLKNSHPCVEGAMHNDCPVCFEKVEVLWY